MELPKRKPNRLKYYDYSTPGAYFITVCAASRMKLFWNGVGADNTRPYGLSGGWFLKPVSVTASRAINLAKIFL